MAVVQLFRIVTVAAASAGAVAGNGGASSVHASDTRPTSVGGDTIEVPADYATIQEAVDEANPGDLILVSPGVYNEAVNVTTDDLTIRGLDRNEVILEGEFDLDNGIRVFADGVAVENMTARNYTFNGFFWTGVDGYRGSYLTAYRIGDYGIYAFGSVNGVFEHSYAAGSPDAGFYIGECYPCNAIIDDVHAEHNGLGYSGTNAGGDLFVINSTFNNNRAGIVPNSGSYELCYPQREMTIAGNLVYDNNQGDTPAIQLAILAMGNGILSAGGVRNTIVNNRVWDHDKTGIGLVPFLEERPVANQPGRDDWDRLCEDTLDDPYPTSVAGPILWDSYENRVIGNVLEANDVADIAVGTLSDDPRALGNCFTANTFTSSAPERLEELAPCDGDGDGDGDWTAGALELPQWLVDAENAPPGVDYEAAELPELGELENMPDADTAPPGEVGAPAFPDVEAIDLPDRPES